MAKQSAFAKAVQREVDIQLRLYGRNRVVEDSKADDEIVYAKSVLDRRIREIVGEDNFSPFDERYGRR